MELWESELWGNPVRTWVYAAATALVLLGALRLVAGVLLVRLKRLSDRTHTIADNILVHVLGRTKWLLVAVVALDIGTRLLVLPPQIDRSLNLAAIVGLVIQAGFWTSAALDVWLRHYRQGDHASDRIRATTVGALHFVIRLVLWSGVTLLALDNLGIDITALVAGLGVGGIAVALAAQTILGDLFASLAIALDKPFLLGDFLVVGEYQGTVEQIGMKTTRLRSLSGEQLIFSNGDLLGSRIRNFQRMTERRVVFKTRLAHDTPREKLRMVPGLIRDAIVQEARIRFDRSHFTGANADGLEHETVYFVLDPDFRLHMDIQQRIGYRLLEAFDREGIEFSRPVHNVHLETDAGGVVSSPQPAPRAGRAGETTSPESGKAADR